MRVDADVLNWFKSKGPGYQTLINGLLRGNYAEGDQEMMPDHRIVDGKEDVTFLVRIKENLEDPTRALLDL